MFFLIVLVLFFFMVIFLSMIFFFFFFFDMDYSKSSGFECGFMPYSINFFFSLPFFIVSLMFLLFDVEIIIMSFPPFFDWSCFIFWFVLFLVLLATCYEWLSGLFIWV